MNGWFNEITESLNGWFNEITESLNGWFNQITGFLTLNACVLVICISTHVHVDYIEVILQTVCKLLYLVQRI